MSEPQQAPEKRPCGCLSLPGRGHRDGCPTLVSLTHADGRPKIAPVQGYSAGIPWSLHLEAYDAYRKKYGAQAALIDIEDRGCRGGFSTRELDVFVPGWRDRVGEIAALRARVAELEEALAAERAAKMTLASSIAPRSGGGEA